MQTLRNVFTFCLLAATGSALGAGCSDGEGSTPLGGGGNPPTTAGGGGAGGSGATTAGTGGTAPLGGSSNPTGGTGGTGSTTGGTGGTGAGGGGAGGTGGATGGTGGATGGSGGSTGGSGGSGGATGGSGGATGGSGGSGGSGVTFPPNCPAPTGARSTTALTRTCWNTKASDCANDTNNKDQPSKAIDVDAALMTRFSSGKKQIATNFTYEIDLGTSAMINGIVATSKATDFAPSLMVSVSTDGNAFTNVACGPGATVTDFSFATTPARYVRLTQYGSIDKWWSVYDLNVYYMGGTDTCAAPGTPTEMCTIQHTTGGE